MCKKIENKGIKIKTKLLGPVKAETFEIKLMQFSSAQPDFIYLKKN